MLPSLRTTVEAHGLLAKKALGQNFLLDRNITGKIIRLSLNAQNLSDYRGAAVYEVGPGPGGLTREILRAEPDKLIVVEMDERCIAIMEEIKAKVGERLQIVNGDALKQNFAEFKQTPRHIVSNLPYNISVPLLVGWLKEMEFCQPNPDVPKRSRRPHYGAGRQQRLWPHIHFVPVALQSRKTL